VTSVGITASKASPQLPGTTIAMTAVPLGGVAPHQYKWQIHDGVRWNPAGTWTTSNTYNWTPTTANPGYKLSVWVRSAGKTTDVAEALTNISFPISATAPPSTDPPPTTQPLVSAVTLTANKPAPQTRGTAITWTAAASGGVTPHEYKFYVWDSATWMVVRGWSTSNTFTWVPTLAMPYYKVRVWVRSAGNNSDNYETSAISGLYPIQ
jgi:hypothetical protein